MSDKELKLKGDQNFDEIRDVYERISELEKDNKTTIENIKENDNIYFKEINELRERDKDQEETITLLKVHINELKEKQTKAIGNQLLFNQWCQEIILPNKEVLRELWNTYILLEVFGATHPIYESLRISIRKLDGVGSARQTVCKHKWDIFYNTKAQPPITFWKCQKCLALHYPEASGDKTEKKESYLFPANWRGSWDEPREDEPKIECSELEMAHLTKDEPREDEPKLCPICGKFLDGDKEWNDYAYSLIPLKREDLKELILFFPEVDDLIYEHNMSEEEALKKRDILKRIKEEAKMNDWIYISEKIIADIKK